MAFDCAKLLLIREGSTILTTGNETRIAGKGDLVFLRTAVLCSGAPEQSVTISTIYIDTDYLFDLWFWLTATAGHSGEAMRAYALGPDFLSPLSYVRPTLDVGDGIGLIFDDLAASLANGPDDFYHAQALVSELLHIVAPLVGARPPRTVPPQLSFPLAAPPRNRSSSHRCARKPSPRCKTARTGISTCRSAARGRTTCKPSSRSHAAASTSSGHYSERTAHSKLSHPPSQNQLDFLIESPPFS